MESKAQNPAAFLQGAQAPAIIETYYEINHLKQLYRQGWLRRGVPKERCESVAEHTFGVALLALLLAAAHSPELDACRAARLALVHDLGEVYAGDLTPSDAASAEEKRRLEAEAVVQIFGKLPGGEEFIRLWQEYEEQSSPEARFVKELDRLEMALQASVYARQGLINPQEFYASASQALSNPELRDLLRSIIAT